jgi:YtkA-like
MRRLAFLLLVHALLGCSSGPEDTSTSTGPLTFVAQPLMTIASRSGQLQIDVRTAPQQPPSRGVQAVQLVILDAMTLTPETGLSLAVLPWMPAMGHGASLTPSVQEGPPGTYVISNVDFFMPGTWEVRTNISGDAMTDYTAPSFQIP